MYTYDDIDLHTDFKTLEIRNKFSVLNNFPHYITFFHGEILGFCMFPSATEFFSEGTNWKSAFLLWTLLKKIFSTHCFFPTIDIDH